MSNSDVPTIHSLPRLVMWEEGGGADKTDITKCTPTYLTGDLHEENTLILNVKSCNF